MNAINEALKKNDDFYVKILEESIGLPVTDAIKERFEKARDIYYAHIYEELEKSALSFLKNEVLTIAREGFKSGAYKSESDATISVLMSNFREFIIEIAAYREASMSTVFEIVERRLNPRPRQAKVRLVK